MKKQNDFELSTELVEIFVSECRENIDITELFIKNGADKNAVNNAFRAFHTIKGAAVGLGLKAFIHHARKAEEVLSECRKAGTGPSEDGIKILSESISALNAMLSDISKDASAILKYKEFLPEEKKAGTDNINLDFADAVKEIKISSLELDAIINMAAENAVKSETAARFFYNNGEVFLESAKSIAVEINSISRTAGALYRSLYALRTVDLKSVENRLASLMPSLCAATGKKAKLVFEGADTRVDKSVVEKLGGPLMHILRNSMDHGIEAPEERIKSGKKEEGLIRIIFSSSSGKVNISIKDDGAGVNIDKVLKKAVEKGLKKNVEKITMEEACNLILMPGFSTAEGVSDISGRGVGMDAVKKYAETLRGTLDILSEKGKGTEVKLQLPLSMSVINVIVLIADSGEFAFDESYVVKVCGKGKDTFFSSQGRLYLRLGSSVIPVYDFENISFERPEKFEGSGFITVIRDENGFEAGLYTKKAPRTGTVISSGFGIVDEFKTVYSGGYMGASGEPCFLIHTGRFIKKITEKTAKGELPDGRQLQNNAEARI